MMRALALAVVLAATAMTFAPVTSNGFVNWDDPDTIVANTALQQGLPAATAWAFTTTHMGHYQPLSWLVYRLAGAPPSPRAVHTLSLVFGRAAWIVCAKTREDSTKAIVAHAFA